MTQNLKTIFHHFRHNIDTEEGLKGWEETLKILHSIEGKIWEILVPIPSTEPFRKFQERVRNLGGKEITLETQHLFGDQWNVESEIEGENGLRLHNKAIYIYHNKRIKEGYYLEQTPEMEKILRITRKCGYCGFTTQEPDQVFCTSCMGSEYLERSNLDLLRLLPVSHKGKRPELSPQELNHLEPLYIEAQTTGKDQRAIKALKQEREEVENNYAIKSRNVEVEYKGKVWINEAGLRLNNLIYYSHTGVFCFGWRQKLDPEVANAIHKKMEGFPYKYEIEVQTN